MVTSKREIYVVGNGYIELRDEHYWVDHHTGNLLLEIESGSRAKVCFVDFEVERKTKGFFQDFSLNGNGLDSFSIRRSRLRKTIDLLKILLRLRSSRFVVLYFPGSLSRLIGLYCALFRLKFGLYVRGEQFQDTSLDAFVIRKASFCAVVSPLLGDRVKKHGCKTSLVRPICNLEEEHFASGSESKKVDSRNYELLFVGRIERSKGVFDLLMIANNLRKLGLNFRIKIVGFGPDFEELLEFSKSLDLTNYVLLVGQIEDYKELYNHYESADALVFPTHHEGFPRVLLEAMAHSLPVFTTMVGGIPGIMVAGENCIAIPVSAPEESARKIFDTLPNCELMDSIRQAAKEAAFEVVVKRPKLSAVVVKNVLSRE
jgi:glycosyltransferase involved in cell wall biosynthesis